MRDLKIDGRVKIGLKNSQENRPEIKTIEDYREKKKRFSSLIQKLIKRSFKDIRNIECQQR